MKIFISFILGIILLTSNLLEADMIENNNILEWPRVSLELVEASPSSQGWVYKVQLTLVNNLSRELKLDGVSVAEYGELNNNLFRVIVDGVRIQYQGKMKDRVPPDHFIELEPGEKYSQTVNLTEYYPIPLGNHQISIAFEHTNHFSPDDFILRSEPIIKKFVE